MSTVAGDLRLALRTLFANRTFAWAAVATLALGVGANVAVLSVADEVLRSPLPYPASDRLVYLYATFKGDGWYATSFPTFQDWARENRVLSRIAVYAEWRNLVLHGGAAPLRVHANFVSAPYFPILGASPERGRFFGEEEDQIGGDNQVVVISHGLWRSHLGADPDIVGRTLTLNDVPFVVIGVMARDFKDLSEVTHSTDVWIPITSTGRLFPPTQLERRTARWMWGVGRLRAGATLERARADLERVGRSVAERFPDSNTDFNVGVKTLKEQVYGDLAGYVRLVTFSSLVILLVAIANFAGLVSVRALDRQGEAAVRSALGGGWLRIARSFLLECLLLSLVALAAGTLAGALGAPLLLRAAAIELPGFFDLRIDPLTWLPLTVLSLGIGLVSGLLSAIRFRRVDPGVLLRAPRTLGGHSFGGVRGALLVAEVALSFVLLVGAGLMLHGYDALRSVELGFRDAKLLTMGVELSSEKYRTDAERARFVEEWTRRASALPGVAQAFAWAIQPPGLAYHLIDLYAQGSTGQPEDLRHGYRHSVSSEGPQELGLTLLEGRWLTAADDVRSTPVALVSRSMAAAAWPDQSALGKRFRWRTRDTIPWHTVVGVVADAKLRGRRDTENLREVYFPFAQVPQRDVVLLTRAATTLDALGSAPADVVRSIDPDLAVSDVASLRSRLAQDLAPARFSALLLGLYAALAVVLAGSALYGLVAYSIRRRTRELGLRLALGADRGAIARLLLRQLLVLLSAGICLGLGASLALGLTFRERIEPLLSGVSVTAPLAYGQAPLVLLLIAGLAAFVPLRRALWLPPSVALRED